MKTQNSDTTTQFVIHQQTHKTIALAIILTILATVFSPNAKADSGVKYTRTFLRQEQSVALRCITDADRACDAASRLLDTGLVPEAGDELVQAFFNLDTADLKLEGELDRIAQLESRPFSYTKSDEQERLSAGLSNLRDQIQNNLARAATFSQHCIQGQPSSALKVYITKRESYRNRIRNGFSEPNIALDECRQLAVFPLAVVVSGLVNVENMARCRVAPDGTVIFPNGQALRADSQPKTDTNSDQRIGADELAALKKQSGELQNQLSRLQEDAKHAPRSLPVTNTLVIIVTNEVRTTVEKPATIQATAPPLPVFAITASNSSAASTTQPTSPSLPSSNIEAGRTLNSPKSLAQIKTPESNNVQAGIIKPDFGQLKAESNQVSTTISAKIDPSVHSQPFNKTHPDGAVLKLAIFAGAFVLLIAVISFTALNSARHRPVKLTITDDNTGNVHEIALINANEIVVLDEEPHSAPNVGQCDAVILDRDWLARVTLHPHEGITLNGTPITRIRRLHIGDRIAVLANSQIRTFVFGGITPLLNNMIEAQPEIAV